jgi:hypothetical protein
VAVTPGVYYLHLAKTAGTTLRWLLEGQYPASTCVYVYSRADRARFTWLSREVRTDIQCFSSNAPLGTYHDLQARLRVITMLREPVSRMLSLYVYRKTLPNFRKHPIQTLPMLNYIDLMAAENEDNAQVRLLSGQGYEGEVTVESLACAKVNLRDACFAFGLQECFDESLVLFRRVFGWQRMAYIRRNNSQLEAPMRDAEVQQRVEAYNRLDIELYEYAKELFAKRLTAEPIRDEERMWVYEAQGSERASIYVQRVIRKLHRLR